MKNYLLNNKERILYYIILFNFLIDFINGIWAFPVSFGQITRTLIMMISLYYIANYDSKKIKNIVLVFVFFITSIMLSFIIDHNSIHGLKLDIKIFYRIFYFIVFTQLLVMFTKKNIIKEDLIRKAIYKSMYIIPVLICISYLLGISKSSYAYGNIGIKGTFISLNALNASLIAMFVFALDKIYLEKKLIDIIGLIIILISLIMLGTKSSFIFIALIFITFIVVFLKNTGLKNWSLKSTFLLIGILFASMGILQLFFKTTIDSIVSMQLYFISNNDLLTYLLSGRNKLLEAGYSTYIDNLNIKNIIFGMGSYNVQVDIFSIVNKASGGIKNIEMDLFDILFSYGVIGTIIIYTYALKLPYNYIKKNFNINRPYIIALISLLIYGLLGGHVFDSPMVTTILASCIAAIYCKKSEYSEKSAKRSKFNIGILHSGDLKNISPGGISQYIEKIIENNDNKSNIVLFGTCEYNSDYELFKEYEVNFKNKKYTFIPVNKNNRKPLSIYYFLNIFKLYLKRREIFNNIDVFYCQRMEYVLPFIFILRDKKVVMGVHGSGKYSYLFWGDFIGTIYNIVERFAINRANKVIVLLNRKEFGVPYYKEKFKKMSDKIVYGKVPIDLDLFKKLDKNNIRKEYGFDNNDKIILYCGRIEDNPKRVMLFPDIAKNLSEKIDNLKWVVTGTGNDLENLKQKIKEYSLEDVFILKGHVSHGQDLVDIINCSDVSIILSNFEGICMSALESIACSVPVIATDVGDINEYIYNNTNGVIIPNSNPENITENASECINDILSNKDKINISDVYKRYDSKVVREELIKILKDA